MESSSPPDLGGEQIIDADMVSGLLHPVQEKLARRHTTQKIPFTDRTDYYRGDERKTGYVMAVETDDVEVPERALWLRRLCRSYTHSQPFSSVGIFAKGTEGPSGRRHAHARDREKIRDCRVGLRARRTMNYSGIGGCQPRNPTGCLHQAADAADCQALLRIRRPLLANEIIIAPLGTLTTQRRPPGEAMNYS